MKINVGLRAVCMCHASMISRTVDNLSYFVCPNPICGHKFRIETTTAVVKSK